MVVRRRPGAMLDEVAWVISRRAYKSRDLAAYLRMNAVRARYPSVTFLGPVFIRKDVVFEVREGFGRIIVGAWCHFGEGSRIRCHEGTLRFGEKTVVGSRVTVNTWLDIDIGGACLFGDDVYVCDFDHRIDDLQTPIKDQGIVKTPVSIGDDVWLGTKVAITRGTRIGAGSVVGAGAVVRGDIPPRSVVVGVPGRVVRSRDPQVQRARIEAGLDTPRLREAVRAVVVDERRRVLLVHFAFEDEPELPHGLWACPGGGVERGETPAEALRRELREETGLVVDDIGEPIWVKEHVFPMERYDGQRDTFYLVQVDADQVARATSSPGVRLHPGALRAEGVDAVRWWTWDEIVAAQARRDSGPAQGGVTFSPRPFAHLLRQVLDDGRPARPRILDPL